MQRTRAIFAKNRRCMYGSLCSVASALTQWQSRLTRGPILLCTLSLEFLFNTTQFLNQFVRCGSDLRLERLTPECEQPNWSRRLSVC